MRIIIAVFLGFLVSCGGPTVTEKSIHIACAANMQYAMDSIAALFHAEYQIKCDFVAASSGMLTAQIENGAPYDVFLSANMNYPETIYKNRNGNKPFVYANGRLLLVANKQKNYKSIDQVLSDPKIKRIGISNDKTAPYGMAASQYLNRSGKMGAVKKRLVVGESVLQINQYLMTGAVDVAFTSYSFKVKNKGRFDYFEVDPTLFDSIGQGAILLKHGLEENMNAGNLFLEFLSSKKCKAVLNYFGYLTD
jgi:molybdate transport system substrate-binding protein